MPTVIPVASLHQVYLYVDAVGDQKHHQDEENRSDDSLLAFDVFGRSERTRHVVVVSERLHGWLTRYSISPG